MLLYKTILNDGVWSQEIEKSKFITHIKNVNSREEADDFIKQIKMKYKDANHNVPAFIIGAKQELKWASDDGEPSGTAGMPILRVLEGIGVTNIVVVITRYFGGIKLGTGGLVRAYTTSTQGGIESLGIASVCKIKKNTIETNYSDFNKIQSYFNDKNIVIKNIQYMENIVFDLIVKPEEEQDVIETVANLTSGQYKLISEKEELEKFKCEK